MGGGAGSGGGGGDKLMDRPNNTYYLLTESEGITEKSQTEALMY